MIVPLVNTFKLNSKNLVRVIEVSQLILYFQIIYQVILKVSTIDLKNYVLSSMTQNNLLLWILRLVGLATGLLYSSNGLKEFVSLLPFFSVNVNHSKYSAAVLLSRIKVKSINTDLAYWSTFWE